MKTKKSFLFITIEEARHICDKIQYGEATLWERLKLSLRMTWCKITRNYTQKNTKLTSLCDLANLKAMDLDKKADLKKLLEKELSENK